MCQTGDVQLFSRTHRMKVLAIIVYRGGLGCVQEAIEVWHGLQGRFAEARRNIKRKAWVSSGSTFLEGCRGRQTGNRLWLSRQSKVLDQLHLPRISDPLTCEVLLNIDPLSPMKLKLDPRGMHVLNFEHNIAF